MPKASVTRHIARDKQTLIDFVLDIEKYPEFVPFCIDSKVYETNDNGNEIEIIAVWLPSEILSSVGLKVAVPVKSPAETVILDKLA